MGALVRSKYRVRVRGDIDGVEFEEVYGIIYTAVPKTFSVQTTIFARSGQAASGEPKVMGGALGRLAGRAPLAAAAPAAPVSAPGQAYPISDEEHLASLGLPVRLGNTDPAEPGGV